MALGSMSDQNCPHCPWQTTQNEHPCEIGSTDDCNAVDELNYDGRVAPLKLKQGPSDAAVVIQPVPVALFAAHGASSPNAPLTALLYPGSPPLNVRFCVFLK